MNVSRMWNHTAKILHRTLAPRTGRFSYAKNLLGNSARGRLQQLVTNSGRCMPAGSARFLRCASGSLVVGSSLAATWYFGSRQVQAESVSEHILPPAAVPQNASRAAADQTPGQQTAHFDILEPQASSPPGIFAAIANFMSQTFRTLHLLALFSPVALSAPIAFWVFPSLLLDSWYQLLVWTISHSGPCIIKLGQWASHRPDFLPVELCQYLQRLRSNTSPHSTATTRRIIEQELGMKVEDVFEYIEPVPRASASIAQVHKARLRTGEDVAVKVRHPGIDNELASDFRLLCSWANALSKIPGLSWLSVPISIDSFATVLQNQLDLRTEAVNLTTFNTNFKNYHRVAFPSPVNGFVTENVLIETWEQGVHIQEYVDAGDPRKNVPLAALGYDVFMSMMLLHNFIHADCHAGNIKVRENKLGEYTLVVLDAGLVTRFAPRGRTQFISLLKDVVTADGEHAADMFLDLSVPGAKCKDPELFRIKMSKLFRRVCGPPRQLSQLAKAEVKRKFRGSNTGSDQELPLVNIGLMIQDIMGLVRTHGMILESDFASVIVSMSILEGLARELDPNIDLLRKLVPFLMNEGVRNLIRF